MIVLENGGPLLGIIGAKNVEKWVQRGSSPRDVEHYQGVWDHIQEVFFELDRQLESNFGRKQLALALSLLFTWDLGPKGFDHWHKMHVSLIENSLSPEDREELAALAKALQVGTKATLEEMI